MNLEFPIRTPTSVLFFILAGIAAYYAQEHFFMLNFAWSSFAWFLYLGPHRWVHGSLVSFVEPGDGSGSILVALIKVL